MIVQRLILPHDGRERRVTCVLPEEVSPSADLVLFLHGSLQSGSVARRFTANTFDALTARGCVVVYPDGVDRHFNDHRVGFNEAARKSLIDDTSFLTSLPSHLAAEFDLNFGQIIGCGFSNGGQMLQRLGLEAPGFLDGIACFGAPWPAADNVLPELAAHFEDWAPVPVLSVQGTADPLVPYEGGVSGIGNANRGVARCAVDSARFFAQLNGLGTEDTNNHAHTETDGLTPTPVNAEPLSTRPIDGVRVDRFGPGVPESPAGGAAPVELWTIEGMGHVVPNPKEMDKKLGPSTNKVVGAELVAHFFGL